MKITLSKSQWEAVGKKSGWMKKAQSTPPAAPAAQAPVAAPQAQAPVQAPAATPAQAPAPVQQSKGLKIILQALQTVEMQANAFPQNGQQIRVLISQIKQLAQSDPSAQSGG